MHNGTPKKGLLIMTIEATTINLNPREQLYVARGNILTTSKISMITEWVAGFFETLKRLFSGGPWMANKLSADAEGAQLSLKGKVGQIQEIDLRPGEELYIRGSSWTASSTDVKIQSLWTYFWSGMIMGTGAMMLQASTEEGPGKLFIRSERGTMKKVDLNNEARTFSADTVIGYSSTLIPSVQMAGNNLFSALFSGQGGLTCELRGTGSVYVASLPQAKPQAAHTWEFVDRKRGNGTVSFQTGDAKISLSV